MLRHIEYLLGDHDCVVIPGLGAVLATHRSASYDATTGVFHAPGRCYTFNAMLCNSDGLLVMSVARSLAVDFNSASRRVDEGVAQIKEQLNRSGEIAIGRIGRIELNADGNLSFVPYLHDRVSHLADWIGDIVLDEAGTIRHHRIQAEAVVAPVRVNRVRRYVRTAMGAAAALLLAIIVSTPVPVKDSVKASMALPPVTAPAKVEAPVVAVNDNSSVELSATDAAGDIAEPATEQMTEPAETTIIAANDSPAQTTETADNTGYLHFDDTDPYVVVVASLANHEDAMKFIQSKKNLNGKVRFGVNRSGRYHRVYAATGATKQAAMRLVNDAVIANNFSGAWVTRR